MKTKIENIKDLRSEILRLKLQRYEQESILESEIKKITDVFKFPSMILHKISSLFGSDQHTGGKTDQVKDGHDWVTNALRLGLPVFLNKFVFRKSGFIMKSVVALVSQKAVTSVNKDLITEWIDKASKWIKGNKPKKRKVSSPDYGIPPDSETY